MAEINDLGEPPVNTGLTYLDDMSNDPVTPEADPAPVPDKEPESLHGKATDADFQKAQFGFDVFNEKGNSTPAPAPTPEEPAQPEEVETSPSVEDLISSTVAQTAQAVGEQFAESMKTAKSPAEPTPPKKEPEDKKTQTFREMEALNPELTGLADKWKASLSKEKEYQENWKKDNAGQKYNPADAEHEAFYSGNDFPIDADQFDAAKESLMRKSIKSELAQESSEQASIDNLKALESETMGSGSGMGKVGMQNFNSALEMMGDPKGEDPLIQHVLADKKPLINQVSGVIEMFLSTGGKFKLDMKDPAHETAARVLQDAESEISHLSEKESIWNGRKFATLKEYNKMPPEDKGGHWTFWEARSTPQKFFSKKIASIAVGEVNNLKQLAGVKVSEKRPESNSSLEAEPPVNTRFSSPPSLSGGSRSAPSQGSMKPAKPPGKKLLSDYLFG